MSHVDDALDTVNNNYAPGKAGSDVRGDAREVQRHGGGGKYNNQLKGDNQNSNGNGNGDGDRQR